MGENDSQGAVQTENRFSSITDAFSRRQVLQTTFGAGIAFFTGQTVSAQEPETTFVLGGDTEGWQGRSPQSIEGKVNPTLQLEQGQTYQIRWENVDGAAHNVAILDGDGNIIERTEIISVEGETQTLQFTATEAMAEYFCEVHPSTMVGTIELVSSEEGKVADQQQQEPAAGGTDELQNATDLNVVDLDNETTTETQSPQQRKQNSFLESLIQFLLGLL